MDTIYINKRVDEYLVKLKHDIRDKITTLNLTSTSASDDDDPHAQLRELLEYVFEYPKLVFEKDESTKKKSSTAPATTASQCIANRTDGSRCTRRCKKGSDCCGTHSKSTELPSVTVDTNNNTYKLEVSAYDIHGIIFYIDAQDNVYCTEDILQGKENPRVVAQAERVGDIYRIPSLGI